MLDLWMSYMLWRAQRRRNGGRDLPESGEAPGGEEPFGPSAERLTRLREFGNV